MSRKLQSVNASALMVLVVAALLLVSAVGAERASAVTLNYTTPGDQNLTIPPGVARITIMARGAAGGACFNGTGGRGAQLTATVPVTPGSSLVVRVGGVGGGNSTAPFCVQAGMAGGVGGGGAGGFGYKVGSSGGAAGGGGASGVSYGSGSLTFDGMLVIAGGGGGAGYGNNGGDAGSPGAHGHTGPGGGITNARRGEAGTQSAGGSGGAGETVNEAGAGSSGGQLTGGTGGSGSNTLYYGSAGGGGGGGYFGGGGGGGANQAYPATGGGGSSFHVPQATNVTAPAVSTSAAQVTITYVVPDPPSAAINSPAAGGAYQLGESVSTSFSCSEGTNGPGLVSCNPSFGSGTVSGGSGALDTSSPGPKTYSVLATSESGFTGQTSIGYSVMQPPTATISAPAPGQSYTVGQSVATSFSCAKGSDGPVLVSCNDSNGTSSVIGGNGTLNTSDLGAHTYTVTATVAGGYTRETSISYNVVPSTPPPPFASPLSVTLKQSRKQTLKEVAKKGVVASAQCSEKCDLKLTLVLTPKLALRHKLISTATYKKLRAKPGSAVSVGTATVALANSQLTSIRVKLTRKASRALGKAKRVKLGLRAEASSGGATATSTLSFGTR